MRALGVALLPAMVLAADYEYSVNPADTNTITITLYTGAGGAVAIPAASVIPVWAGGLMFVMIFPCLAIAKRWVQRGAAEAA